LSDVAFPLTPTLSTAVGFLWLLQKMEIHRKRLIYDDDNPGEPEA